MFQITKTQTRQDPNTPFFHEIGRSDEYKEYFNTNYRATNKIISVTRTLSEDSLTLTSVTVWSSEEVFHEFIIDSYCNENYLIPSQIYDIENFILAQTVTEII